MLDASQLHRTLRGQPTNKHKSTTKLLVLVGIFKVLEESDNNESSAVLPHKTVQYFLQASQFSFACVTTYQSPAVKDLYVTKALLGKEVPGRLGVEECDVREREVCRVVRDWEGETRGFEVLGRRGVEGISMCCGVRRKHRG